MMTVREAKRVAKGWAAANLPDWPRVVGAVFAGSIGFKTEDATWPGGSDVDLWVFQDGELSPRLAKFGHGGVILEVAGKPASELDDLDRALSDPHLAPHLARGEIVFDPTGKLRALHERIAPSYANLEWITARMDWATQNAKSKYQRCIVSTDESMIGPLCVFILGVRNAAALSAIAALDNPTFRRCLVLQREQLVRYGFGDLHEESLAIVGSTHMTAADVQAMVTPIRSLYRRACVIARTPFWALFELDPTAESLFIDGTQEMIDAGDFREAVLFILFIHYFCHQAIASDGSMAEKAQSAAELRGVLLAVGISSLDEMQTRARGGLDLLSRIRNAAETIASRHALA